MGDGNLAPVPDIGKRRRIVRRAQYASPPVAPTVARPAPGGNARMQLVKALTRSRMNATVASPVAPAEIHPPLTASEVSAVYATEFRPRVGDAGVLGSAVDITSHPNYLGGPIGFALVGGVATCMQTHYSDQRINQMSVYGTPWILSLMYQSGAATDRYYFAFEDLPSSTDQFDPPSGSGAYQNDGDFNDFVYLVTGITHCDPNDRVELSLAHERARSAHRATAAGRLARSRPRSGMGTPSPTDRRQPCHRSPD